MKQKPSVLSAAMDSPISIENDWRTNCTLKNHKSFDFELQEPIKAFNGRLRSYLSIVGGRVVSSGAEAVDFVRRNEHIMVNRLNKILFLFVEAHSRATAR